MAFTTSTSGPHEVLPPHGAGFAISFLADAVIDEGRAALADQLPDTKRSLLEFGERLRDAPPHLDRAAKSPVVPFARRL